MLFAVLRHEDVHAQCDPSGARYAYNEVMLAAFVRGKGVIPSVEWDSTRSVCMSMTTRRWPPGARSTVFPRRWLASRSARTRLAWSDAALRPVRPQAPCNPSRCLALSGLPMRKRELRHWRYLQVRVAGGETPFALPLFGDLARLMVFYNTRHLAQPGARKGAGADISQLTKVALADLKVSTVSALHDLRLRAEASVNDPVYLLMQGDRDAAEIRASWGVKVEFSFSMGTARIVGAAQGTLDARVLGQILRESRGLGY